MTALGYSRNLGKVGSDKKSGFIMLGYDDIYSIQYFEKNLKAYWTHDGKTDIFQAFKSAEADYATIMGRCDNFNRTMMADAEKREVENMRNCVLWLIVRRYQPINW